MLRTFSILVLVAAVALALFTAPKHIALAAPPEAAAPVSLVNPDGQALNLEKYQLRVAVHGALSLVEMEMTFRNPEAKQMEGRFSYTLPTGATLSRFAKEVNGKLMEGEVVERLRAQAIFTEILHTMRDPALLETDQGNKFSARVFPVPASGTVRLLLSFSKLLPAVNGERKLIIPLAGMPKIGEFEVTAVARPLANEALTAVLLDKDETLNDTQNAVTRHAANFVPQRDLELTFKTPAEGAVRAIKAGNMQMVQFVYQPDILKKIVPPAHDMVFYFDTSASGAGEEAARLQVIDKLLNDITPFLREEKTRLSARAFDIERVELCNDLAPGDADKTGIADITHRLRARHSLGATDLGAALKRIGDEARASQQARVFVLVSDGIPTWGAREPKELLEALGAWPEKDTLHALVIGAKQDERILKALTEKTHGRIVNLPVGGDVAKNSATALLELYAPAGANFEVYDEAAEWIYPASFKDVRPGQEMIAFAKLKENGKSAPGFVQRGADGKAIKDTPVVATPLALEEFAPLLRREATKAYLDVLDKQEQAATDAMKRAELRKLRIETSVKNRVLCPLTSLLVLESENDYRRFNIDRSALPEILEVAQHGIQLRKRGPEDVPPPAPAKVEQAMKRMRAFSPATKRPEELEKSLSDSFGFDDRSKDANAADRGSGVHPFRQLSEDENEVRESLGRIDRVDGLIRDFPGPRIDVGTAGTHDASGGNPFAAPPATVSLTAGAVSAETPHPTPHSPLATATPAPINAPVGASPEPHDATTRDGIVTHGLRNEARQRRAEPAAAGVNASADWTAQATELPSDAQLSELRARVQAAPLDRKLRNAYADSLARAAKWDNLQAEVFQWLPFDPENPAVYEYLGKSATGLNDPGLALRAYSSIAEIAPNRAALLSRAGFLLLAAEKYDLAEALFREALKNRQDDCNIYRGLALTLTLAKRYEAAAGEYEGALMRDFNQRYGDTKRVLREEYAYLLRAWRKAEPSKSDALVSRAQKAGVDMLATDALRVTLCWETDANDVDLHVVDPNHEECFYNHKNNASGLELYSDQTQGLGPEVIRTAKTIPGAYHIGVNYFSAGPMGVSRGVVVIHKPVDGIDEHPQIVPFCLIEGGRDMRWIGTTNF